MDCVNFASECLFTQVDPFLNARAARWCIVDWEVHIAPGVFEKRKKPAQVGIAGVVLGGLEILLWQSGMWSRREYWDLFWTAPVNTHSPLVIRVWSCPQIRVALIWFVKLIIFSHSALVLTRRIKSLWLTVSGLAALRATLILIFSDNAFRIDHCQK